MSTLAPPRLRLSRSVRAGEAFEVRTLVQHPMETGLRRDGARLVPRDMLASIVVTPSLDSRAEDMRNSLA